MPKRGAVETDCADGELAAVGGCGEVFLGAFGVDDAVGVPVPRLGVGAILRDSRGVGLLRGGSEGCLKVGVNGGGSVDLPGKSELPYVPYISSNRGSFPMGEGRAREVGRTRRKPGTSWRERRSAAMLVTPEMCWQRKSNPCSAARKVR